MKRSTRVQLLVEDFSHQTFLLTVFTELGFHIVTTNPPLVKASAGEAWVKKYFPVHHQILKKKPHVRSYRLVVMIDGDGGNHASRREELRCTLGDDAEIDPRVLIIVPRWEIEVWLAYLDSGVVVDETSKAHGYPKYTNREKEIKPLAKKLAAQCKLNTPLENVPESLKEACEAFREWCSE